MLGFKIEMNVPEKEKNRLLLKTMSGIECTKVENWMFLIYSSSFEGNNLNMQIF